MTIEEEVEKMDGKTLGCSKQAGELWWITGR
jgi:hypothetical protein